MGQVYFHQGVLDHGEVGTHVFQFLSVFVIVCFDQVVSMHQQHYGVVFKEVFVVVDEEGLPGV